LVGVHGFGSEPVVVLEELSNDAAVDVEASGTVEDARPEVIEGVSVALPFVPDAGSSAGVEVEETNGGAFSIYELSACTAYSPTSRSPLGVS
jgi:hypothetical protein